MPGTPRRVRGQLGLDPGPTDRPVPPGAQGHEDVADGERVTVGRDAGRPGLLEPERRLLVVRVGTGQVVVPRGHRHVGDGLQEGEVLQRDHALGLERDR